MPLAFRARLCSILPVEKFHATLNPGFLMRNSFLIALASAALLLPAQRNFAAADAPAEATAAAPSAATVAAPSTAAAEFKDLTSRIMTSMKAGQTTEASQADHLKEFDALLAKHKGETNDDVAQIAFMKATLYLEVFKQTDKATEMLKQVQRDFPNTVAAKTVDSVLASIKQGEEAKKVEEAMAAAAKKVEEALAVGAAFPDFDVQDLDGKPLSIASYKGKVVMLDFWATWCGPCVGEVPNVAEVYSKYHDKGFEIIGISLDQAGAKDKLTAFTKEHNMPWRQYFDGKFWSNELAVKYGVQSIPATYLLDGSGRIIAKNVRGPALEPAVKKALGIN
jgi:thiol-disulfide isomerase/thioredoxin